MKMATANFVPCTKCHAEISDDREACPHCGAEIVSESRELTKLQDENAKLRGLAAERKDALKAENEALRQQVQ